MFIVLLFVSIKLTGTVDKTNCSISTIPTELLEGVNNSKHQYLGLSNTINNLSDFNDESGKIKESLGINFDNINSELLRESSEKVIKSVTSYANQNKGKQRFLNLINSSKTRTWLRSEVQLSCFLRAF